MLRKQKIQQNSRGFTLIEIIIGIAIAGILFVAVLSTFSILARGARAAREQTVLASLANNYLEIIRNLPYSQVGTVNGNPSGTLWDFTNAQTSTIENVAYKVYYEVTYVDDPADGTILAGTDPSPNDYKQVKMFVQNTVSGLVTTFLTTVSPKGLEGLNNAGAIWIKAFNSQGQPLSGATIHIVNTALSPNIILDRQTDSQGNWIEVGLPDSVNGYHMSVTKPGYSTDQTSPITIQNPNPTKPDSTVATGSVTQVSFSIDTVSNLTIKTLDSSCQSISGVNLNISGAKLIGTSPNVLKFNNNYSSAAGQIALNNIEWDTYTPILLTGQNWVMLGTSPVQEVTVLPGASATFTMVLGTSTTPNTFLVIVKDASTGAAIEGAAVHLQKPGSPPEDYYAASGGSVWTQTDWTGGSGQSMFSTKTRYYIDDGNIDTTTIPTALRLKKISGNYQLAGWLESSTFDTGAASNFTTLTWQPTSQDPSTTVRFQVATSTDSNNNGSAWDYKGPDGTSGTYYTVSGTSLNSVHDNDRYARYKVLLSTADNQKTPVLTSTNLNYVSGCHTPGQVAFTDLNAANNYTLDVSLAGYATKTVSSLNISGNQTLEVTLTPAP